MKNLKENDVKIVSVYTTTSNLDEAKRIMGFVFKENALNYFEENPKPKMKHKVIILHKTKKLEKEIK